jgi:hypothetical protein
MATNTEQENQVKMYKREVDLNEDGGVKTDPDPALDEQAGIGIGFLLGNV